MTYTSEFVDTFGQHKLARYHASTTTRTVLDACEVEQHADGTYTLYLDAEDYVNAIEDQWYSTPRGVVEAHGDDSFLTINSAEQAEEVARVIAFKANREIHEHYIVSPDTSIAEALQDAYERLYDEEAPEFNLDVSGRGDAVEVEALVEYWEEEHSDD